ncbi:MAG TPA: DUF3224 domain-containing protein [Pyrinomonadaceae bacterium]|nr:DUF3224 domain-containing protein [Pyrinomonadaceae bacterium]
MKTGRILLLLVAGLCGSAAPAQTNSLAGDWTGESICAGGNPSCHDEHVVYHISVDPADATRVKISADKVIDGKLEWMGDISLKYDAAKQTLTGDMQSPRYKGIWEFAVKGEVIEGTLSIFNPEKTVGRRIKVQRRPSSPKDENMVHHATGTFEVKLTPQDDKSDDRTLGRMTIEKQWHGDIDGASKGQMLTGGDVSKGSGGYVAIEKFAGTVSGRKGSLIFQHTGTMNRGAAELTVIVVPDSGTDELAGITGKLTIKIESGKHLYEFDYTLP